MYRTKRAILTVQSPIGRPNGAEEFQVSWTMIIYAGPAIARNSVEKRLLRQLTRSWRRFPAGIC